MSKSEYGEINLRGGSVRSILEIYLEIVEFLVFSRLILIVKERLIYLVFPTATFIISVSDLVSTWGWYALRGLRRTMWSSGISRHSVRNWHEVILLSIILIRLECHEVVGLMQLIWSGMMVLRYWDMLYRLRRH